MTAVLEARGLGKRYGRLWALSDCTLDIPAGQVAGLVGPNGAGKTTLLNLAGGMLTPTSGTITVLGGRLAWNQSVTRMRWAVTKVGLIGLASMATAGLISLMLTWWASPVDRAAGLAAGHAGILSLNRLAPVLFAVRGIAPIAHAAFAFALGATVGVLVRRSIPTMAVTLAVFAFVQLAVPRWVRPHLVSPLRLVKAFDPAALSMIAENGGKVTVKAAADIPGAWIISNQTITPAGHVFTGPAPAACRTGAQTCAAALGKLDLRQVITYQPASHFWALQWYETAIFLAVALALAGTCVWRLRRVS